MVTRASTQTKLLDAADELLFTQGVANTPVDQILERAGVSPATLYRAYRSKEALVAAALDRGTASGWTCGTTRSRSAPDDRERLLAVFDGAAAIPAPGRAEPGGARSSGPPRSTPTRPRRWPPPYGRRPRSMRQRLQDLARPVAGAQAHALAEALALVVSGQLAMRLRDDRQNGVGLARMIAETLIDHPDQIR